MTATDSLVDIGQDMHGETPVWLHAQTQREYERNLPGGGFVAIDVTAEKTMPLGPRYEGTLVIERRASPRREGHHPPVIARAAGLSVDSVVLQLLPTAQSNSAIGAGLLQLKRPRSETTIEAR